MTKRISAFEKQCVTINRRLKDKLSEKTTNEIYYRSLKVGPITRMWHKRRIYYCSECGCEVNNNVFAKECPQCHAKWNSGPEPYMCKTVVGYYMTMEAKGDIQLCRLYKARRTSRFGHKAETDVWEVERFFYAPTGERKIFTVNFCPYSYIVDSFSLTAEWHMRNEYSWDQRAALRYNLPINAFRIKSLTKQWQYKDIANLLERSDNKTSVLKYIAYPWAETWHKEGQNRLLRYICANDKPVTKELIQTVKICTRHHYIITDPSMWLDQLDLLKEFHLDTYNPKFICPDNLHEAHQQLIARSRREWEKRAYERKEQELQERMEREPKFAKMVAQWSQHMGDMLAINLTSDNLSIRPLQSVSEFKKEGRKMHHCVFLNEYWNYNLHPYSLILSAKDDKGKRLATIEWNMKTNEIVQCNAACNQVPERYDEICKLITDNKAQFVKLESTIKRAA